MAVSLDEYRKALKSLREALELEKTDITRDASIQRFEFCVELAWKVGRKVMGTSTSAPKMVVRELAQQGLIDDPEMWIEFINARNKSAHTYNEDVAEEVFASAKAFLVEGESLLSKYE